MYKEKIVSNTQRNQSQLKKYKLSKLRLIFTLALVLVSYWAVAVKKNPMHSQIIEARPPSQSANSIAGIKHVHTTLTTQWKLSKSTITKDS